MDNPSFVTITETRSGTKIINITPGATLTTATHTITVLAESEGKTATGTFTVTVNENIPLMIDSITPNPVALQAGTTANVTVMASDPDGTTPAISLVGNTLTFVTLTDNGDGTATIDITPDASEPSARHTITVRAESEGETAEMSLILTIGDDTDGDTFPDIVDVDDDNDGLIEIHFLEDLDNMRHDLAGTSYKTNAGDSGSTAGAPSTRLKGYELARSLDFQDDESYADTAANKNNWTTGEGLDSHRRQWHGR